MSAGNDLRLQNQLLTVQARSDAAELARLHGVLTQAREMLEKTADALQVTHQELEHARTQLGAIRALVDRWRLAGLRGCADDAEHALATGTH
jgi:conjugal transfer/entry exclusion protein